MENVQFTPGSFQKIFQETRVLVPVIPSEGTTPELEAVFTHLQIQAHVLHLPCLPAHVSGKHHPVSRGFALFAFLHSWIRLRQSLSDSSNVPTGIVLLLPEQDPPSSIGLLIYPDIHTWILGWWSHPLQLAIHLLSQTHKLPAIQRIPLSGNSAPASNPWFTLVEISTKLLRESETFFFHLQVDNVQNPTHENLPLPELPEPYRPDETQIRGEVLLILPDGDVVTSLPAHSVESFLGHNIVHPRSIEVILHQQWRENFVLYPRHPAWLSKRFHPPSSRIPIAYFTDYGYLALGIFRGNLAGFLPWLSPGNTVVLQKPLPPPSGSKLWQ